MKKPAALLKAQPILEKLHKNPPPPTTTKDAPTGRLPERAIVDEEGLLKPTYRFAEEGSKETVLLNKTAVGQQHKPPQFPSAVLDKINNIVGPSVGCLYVVYGNGSVFTATAFQVAAKPPTFAIARHSYEPISFKDTTYSHQDMYITTRVDAAYSFFEAFTGNEKVTPRFIKVRVIPGLEEFRERIMKENPFVDLDPMLQEDLGYHQGDLSFVEAEKIPNPLDMHLGSVLYPGYYVEQGDELVIVGYAGQPKEQDLEYYKVTEGKPVHLEDLFQVFVPDVKSLSHGKFLYGDMNVHMFAHSCSTLGGHSGGPVIATGCTDQFIGMHVGGLKDTLSVGALLEKRAIKDTDHDSFSFNWNAAMSTVHPLFAALYKEYIVPRFGDKVPPQVSAYLQALK
jgi:hypothetical protein